MNLPPDRAPYPRMTRQTRVRLLDDAGETLGVIWTAPDADDEHVRSLIPEGVRAMIARNIWP
jgi:ribosomal 50S subunit-associated protein YjgA (DUF615 family)